MYPKFTCSIVLYSKDSSIVNSKKYRILKDAINNITMYPNLQSLLIVDNSPYPYFSKCFQPNKSIAYIHLGGRNIGFGAAHNLARTNIPSAPYHLFLNPDIVFQPDIFVINALLSAFDHESSVSMVQPLITYPDFSTVQYLCKRNPSLLSQFLRLASLPYPFSKFLKKYMDYYEMREIAYSKRDISSTYLSGSFMLCKRCDLDKVGWFDERFFMYLEDADLTRKLSLIGNCLHIPRYKVGHLWERGSHKDLRLALYAITSFYKYSVKWGLKIF